MTKKLRMLFGALWFESGKWTLHSLIWFGRKRSRTASDSVATQHDFRVIWGTNKSSFLQTSRAWRPGDLGGSWPNTVPTRISRCCWKPVVINLRLKSPLCISEIEASKWPGSGNFRPSSSLVLFLHHSFFFSGQSLNPTIGPLNRPWPPSLDLQGRMVSRAMTQLKMVLLRHAARSRPDAVSLLLARDVTHDETKKSWVSCGNILYCN